jgi:hypothetical protein
VKKEKPTCTHCKKEGHSEDRFWILHLELKPTKFRNKVNPKTTETTQTDLGYDSRDETKVIVTGIKGKNSKASTSSSVQSLKFDNEVDEIKRTKLFHIRIISKHTKIDTLFDNGSQVNLISETIVKKLGLTTKNHKKSYPLGWIHNDNQLQVNRKCVLKFSIASQFIYEVELDVVLLDICGILLGSPYLFDRKEIFYHEDNKYQLTKYGKEYVLRSHQKKLNLSLINSGKMKRTVNVNKRYLLMVVKTKETIGIDTFQDCDTKLKDDLVRIVSDYDDIFQVLKGLPPK